MEEINNVTVLPEHYEEQLQHIIDAGFKPIGVTQMMLEDTFIFRHADEAHKAYEEMEKKYMLKQKEQNLKRAWSLFMPH